MTNMAGERCSYRAQRIVKREQRGKMSNSMQRRKSRHWLRDSFIRF